MEKLRTETQYQLAVHPLGLPRTTAQKIVNRFLMPFACIFFALFPKPVSNRVAVLLSCINPTKEIHMKKLKLWILIIGLIFISACGASGDMGGESSAPQPENQKIEEGAADTQPEITGESNPDRKTIDTLNLYMTVLNFQEADTRIQDLLKQHKGILISSNQYKSGNYRRTGDYQFKIPPEENDVFYKQYKNILIRNQ